LCESFSIIINNHNVSRGASSVELEELEKFKWHEPEQEEVEAEEVYQF
jgi:hypothetical protein